MSIQTLLRGAEMGLCCGLMLKNYVEYKRILQLEVSARQLLRVQCSSISSMQLDPIEHHYLISAGSGRSIYIHNTWHRDSCDHVPLVKQVEGTVRYQHKKAIHCIQWYPQDTGMFVTSSFDGNVKIWDTNNMKPVETMNIGIPVKNHHMSSASHSLIAAAASSQIRLADIRTGSATHTLQGHNGNVLCVKWSPKDLYTLSSGSADNKLNTWDVRNANSILHSFDQLNGIEDDKKSLSGATAHSGHVNSLQYSEDGRYLLSFGTDERMRLWDADTGKNTLINYGRIENTSQHLPLSMSLRHGGASSSIIFVPSGRHVLLFNFFTGQLLRKLSEHFSAVRCCEYNPLTQELITCASSSRMLIWSPNTQPTTVIDCKDKSVSLMSDTWSDSE